MLVDLDLREHPSRAIEKKTHTHTHINRLEKEFCRRSRQIYIYIYILNAIEYTVIMPLAIEYIK